MWAGSAAYCRSTTVSLVEKDSWERLKAPKKKEMLWPLTWVLGSLVPLYNVPKNWRYTRNMAGAGTHKHILWLIVIFLWLIAGDTVATVLWRVESLLQYSFWIFLVFTSSLLCNYTSMLNFCHFILYPYSIVRKLFILLLMYIIMILTWKATVLTQKVLHSCELYPSVYFLNYTAKL